MGSDTWEDVQQIMQKPGNRWTDPERARVIDWIMKEHLKALVRFAYQCLQGYHYHPPSPWDEASDMVMEALANALQHLSSFDPTKGPLLVWLKAIVRNCCHRLGGRNAARRGREAPLEGLDAQGNVVPVEIPDPAPPAAEEWALRTSIEQLSNLLKEPYRTAVRWCILEGHTAQEWAQRQGIRVNHARVQYHWGMHMVRAYQREEEEIIACLPSPYSHALILHRFWQLPAAALAQRLGLTTAAAERRVQLAWRLYCLPEPYRHALILHHCQGLPAAALAQRLGLTTAAAERRVQLASRLQTSLQEAEHLSQMPEPLRSVLILRGCRRLTDAEIARNHSKSTLEVVQETLQQAWQWLLEHQGAGEDV
jgi:RNA polymerase sigma factor (sigma-70 family)